MIVIPTAGPSPGAEESYQVDSGVRSLDFARDDDGG